MPSVVDYILKFSKPGYRILDEDRATLKKLSVVCRQFLRFIFVQFIHANRNEPLFFHYSCDSTPASISQRFTTAVEYFSVVRQGKMPRHLVAERCFLFDTNGHCRINLDFPAVIKDTTAWCHFACFKRLGGYPREYGHKGGELNHHIWDGAVKSAGERIHSKYMLGLEDAQALQDDDDETYRLWCVTLATFITCIMHHAHNCFKRGLSTWLDKPVVMRAMWICQESLRSSFGLFACSIGPWLSIVLSFEAWDFTAAGELWSVFLFKDEWLLLMVNLEIRFQDGLLKVNPAYRFLKLFQVNLKKGLKFYRQCREHFREHFQNVYSLKVFRRF